METRSDNRSLGELFGELTRELSMLMRQEMTLARKETVQILSSATKNLIWLTVGAVVLFAGFLALIATAIIAIAYALPWWLSALIVTVVVLGIGAACVIVGYEGLKKQKWEPQRTMSTLKEDGRWMKEQTT